MADAVRTERKETMAKENAKTHEAAASRLSPEQLHAVTGGTQSEEDYAVTSDKKCPYCGSTKVNKSSMQRNIGFTKVLREYACRTCEKHFWLESHC